MAGVRWPSRRGFPEKAKRRSSARGCSWTQGPIRGRRWLAMRVATAHNPTRNRRQRWPSCAAVQRCWRCCGPGWRNPIGKGQAGGPCWAWPAGTDAWKRCGCCSRKAPIRAWAMIAAARPSTWRGRQPMKRRYWMSCWMPECCGGMRAGRHAKNVLARLAGGAKRTLSGCCCAMASTPTPKSRAAWRRSLQPAALAIGRGRYSMRCWSTVRARTPGWGQAAKAAVGTTALMCACLYPGSHGMVKRLLAAGADPNLTDKNGLAALSRAGDGETALLLLDAGARVREEDVAHHGTSVRAAIDAWQAAMAQKQLLGGGAWKGSRRRT